MAFETVLNKSKESKIKYFLQLESGHYPNIYNYLQNVNYTEN